ncbi:hypothetical protein Tco_0605973 [Tanacetum coccineum]
MTKSKSFNKNHKHRALYHALIELILEDEDAMDKGVADELKKRKPDDADKDEGSFESSKEKYPYASSKSSKSGRSAKDQVEEPIFVQTRLSLNNDLSLNNKCAMDHEKTWLNDMAKDTKPPLTFDELMHTPIDFSSFAMNHLKIDNLTKEHLVGLVYNLLKGTCKSYVELDYTMEECYPTLSEQPNWNNPRVIVVPMILPNIYMCKCHLKVVKLSQPTSSLTMTWNI